MSVLRTLRGRIQSIKSIQKISSAMKMVASTKLNQAQRKAFSSKPYSQELDALIERLLLSLGPTESLPLLLSGDKKNSMHKIIVLSSNKGLCGSFNGHLIREVNAFVQGLESAPFQILCVGQKGRELLKPFYNTLLSDAKSVLISADLEEHLEKEGGKKKVAEKLAQILSSEFSDGKIGQVTLFHNTFKSIISQKIRIKQLVPFSPQKEKTVRKKGGSAHPSLLCKL